MFITKGTASAITRRQFSALAAGLAAGAAVRPGVSLADSQRNATDFKDVPNEYRMRMHWYIFGPAWTPEECARELKLMAAANLGGVLVFPTYPIALDDPQSGIHNQEYLSPAYLSVFRSMVESARGLGLTVDTVLGTGWPYGGPSVSVEQSAHQIRRIVLPVLEGKPVRMPTIPSDENVIAAFHVRGADVLDVTAPLVGDSWTPHREGGELQVFVAAPTRMRVKRAALGAEGLVLDHYNRAALDDFLAKVGDKLVEAASPGGIRSVFSDSLEVYRATWTAGFPAVFRAKRRYDLLPRLTALFDSAHPDSRDLRCDFWRTLSDLANEAYVQPLSEWAHRRGVTTQVEAYGTPPVSLVSYRNVDVPVGEHYEWKEFSSSRWASSGAHLAGKPRILAEAWTWTGLPNRFSDTLEQLKLCSDLHFLSGINALYGLTYAYSPQSVGSPGWVPYFGPSVNHTSPYWDYFRYLVDYVNRASYVLQQGKPVADVALYLPAEDCMADAGTDQLLMNWAVRDRLSSNGPPPEFSLANALHYESNIVKTIVTNGYSLDGVDTFSLREGVTAENGRLRIGDGDYSIVVLPNLKGIDLSSLRIIAAFVRGGGIVIATRRLPDIAWGMNDREKNRNEVQALIEDLFGIVNRRNSFGEHAYGKGKAFFVIDEQGSLLRALRSLTADLQLRAPSEHVSFVHRRAPNRDYYFIANTSTDSQMLDVVFRVGAEVPALWDLRSGETEEVAVFEPTPGGPRLRFTLGAFESRVYSFEHQAREPLVLESNLELRSDGSGWRGKAWSNGSFFIRRSSGVEVAEVADVPSPFVLRPRWRIRFEGARLDPVETMELRSWTEIPEARFFSGSGVYEAEFKAPAFKSGEIGIMLDLGSVRETADVSLNGKAVGVAWMRPYQVDVTESLRPGTNALRIIVTNLLINEILGKGRIDYSAVFAKYGDRFPAGDEWDFVGEPFISGLLGPVRLVFYKLLRGK